ncbi:hypothetical protein COB72_07310 [bacterium]|nr:MAG: hypothetical protein COB72_07310 [bacterium]
MSSINSATSLLLINSLNSNQRSAMNTLERLATGNAINRASDNPSGLIASENFATRLNVIQTKITSFERNEAVLNIQDGRLSATLDNVSDLTSLVIQGASTGGMTSSEMGAIQTQIGGILTGITRIAAATGLDIMNDVTTEMVVGTDETTGDPITETVSLSDLSRVLETDPEAAQRLVDGARQAVVTAQAEVGIEARASESERRILEEEQINVARAYSQIRDTNYAKESSNLIRSQILEKASIYTILAERQSAANVLTLLGDLSG